MGTRAANPDGGDAAVSAIDVVARAAADDLERGTVDFAHADDAEGRDAVVGGPIDAVACATADDPEGGAVDFANAGDAE
jgi:hypothetical protein